MANHQQWQELTIIEKVRIVGQLTHLLQNDEKSFKAFTLWIKSREKMGLFNEVKINSDGGNS